MQSIETQKFVPLTASELTPPLLGLSTVQAAERLKQYGPNRLPEVRANRVWQFLKKFWSPVPWMLEITVLLELYLGKEVEAIVITCLLVFNALLSFWQESQAQNALALLRQRLVVQTSTRRDGTWCLLPADQLVPGDIIHLRMGNLVPADLILSDGTLELDQSTLTGESLPVEAAAGMPVYAGAIVKRGEATGQITATGSQTRFGQTSELVRTAKPVSHLGEIIFAIVKYLVMADSVLVAMVLGFALYAHIAWNLILPFALMILIASVPVALPATFTLATALGAADLVHQGILVSRLSAIEDAAAMSILASDKTGTITENRLVLKAIRAYPPYQEEDVIAWGSMASRAATQDALDLAILAAAKERSLSPSGTRLEFTPFEPQTKRSAALFQMKDGRRMQVLKGAPQTIADLAGGKAVAADVSALAAQGNRVLAVATGPEGGHLELIGLLGLQDTPRPDSAGLIHDLNDLGVRVVMVTGDDVQTARSIAAQVGLQGDTCSAEDLKDLSTAKAQACSIFAGVFPEDKFHLVQGWQRSGLVVGMTGDGVNDAPALKQAEVGIAVASATDVAKAAASLVLTAPGLGNILAAVKTSRRIYQRMLTYTLNKIIKTFQIALFLSLSLMITRQFVVTPLLIILLLFANDFVTMSIATDNVAYSQKPDRWNVPALMQAALGLALPVLLLSFGFLFVGLYGLDLPLPQLQTFIFIMLVFTGQANVYLVRERRHFWESRPSKYMIAGTLGDILVVTFLATRGILMTAIPLEYVALSLATVLILMPCVDWLKIAILKLTHIE